MADPERMASFLLKPLARACKEFDLLGAGDRVAVGVSGGKDSRALLDLLLRYQQEVPFRYEVVAVHVVGVEAGLPEARDTLEPWLTELGVTYHFVPLELPSGEPLPMDCFRCSYNRRKTLLRAADALGCQKIALGHHADDVAATTLLNLLFSGRVGTLKPKREFFAGRLALIRPLIYIPAKELSSYARASGFVLPPPCPQEENSHRRQVEQFLRSFGQHQKRIRANLRRAAREQQQTSEVSEDFGGLEASIAPETGW